MCVCVCVCVCCITESRKHTFKECVMRLWHVWVMSFKYQLLLLVVVVLCFGFLADLSIFSLVGCTLLFIILCCIYYVLNSLVSGYTQRE